MLPKTGFKQHLTQGQAYINIISYAAAKNYTKIATVFCTQFTRFRVIYKKERAEALSKLIILFYFDLNSNLLGQLFVILVALGGYVYNDLEGCFLLCCALLDCDNALLRDA